MLKIIIISIILASIILGLPIGYFVWGYPWNRDVNSYFKLADQSSSLDKKLEYFEKYKNALLEKGLDKGQARYIFQTPQTELSNQMIVLDSLIGRLQQTKELNPKSLEYQQAIKQLTTDEFQGFNTCLFLDGYKRQSIIRFLYMVGGDCQSGKYAGEGGESF